jgi:hypothetical protein
MPGGPGSVLARRPRSVVPSRRETLRIGIVRCDTGTDKEPAMTNVHQHPRSGADRADGIRRAGLAPALFMPPTVTVPANRLCGSVVLN